MDSNEDEYSGPHPIAGVVSLKMLKGCPCHPRFLVFWLSVDSTVFLQLRRLALVLETGSAASASSESFLGQETSGVTVAFGYLEMCWAFRNITQSFPGLYHVFGG